MIVKVIKIVSGVCHIDRHQYSDGGRSGYNTVYAGTCSLIIWRPIFSVYVNWSLKLEITVSSEMM